MQYEWWQLCLITLSKGLAWAIPIVSIFIAANWFITDLIKETVEKKYKANKEIS